MELYDKAQTHLDLHNELLGMLKPDLVTLARKVNQNTKIQDLHKLKKSDLVIQLMLRAEEVYKIKKKNVKLKPKKVNKKGKNNNEEINKLLKEMNILLDETINTDDKLKDTKINLIMKKQKELSKLY